MSDEIGRYLTDSYRRDILGESVEVGMPAADPQLIARVETMIAGIDGVRLGANLAQRDFVSYQHRRALVRLLAQLKAQQAAEAQPDAPD
jgi:hypothetical protein